DRDGEPVGGDPRAAAVARPPAGAYRAAALLGRAFVRSADRDRRGVLLSALRIHLRAVADAARLAGCPLLHCLGGHRGPVLPQSRLGEALNVARFSVVVLGERAGFVHAPRRWRALLSPESPGRAEPAYPGAPGTIDGGRLARSGRRFLGYRAALHLWSGLREGLVSPEGARVDAGGIPWPQGGQGVWNPVALVHRGDGGDRSG